MTPFVASLNYYLSLGTIALQIAIVLIALAYVFRTTEIGRTAVALVARFAFPLAFLSALGGTAMTLFYSDYLGFIPCGLCWFQRIFLYPQIALLCIAWFKKDRGVWKYVITLSVLGLIVALYQHYLQIGGSDLIPCPASGNGDCGKRIIYEFSYITFPLMSATLFAWQALLGFISKKAS